jgi:hypothetical protein
MGVRLRIADCGLSSARLSLELPFRNRAFSRVGREAPVRTEPLPTTRSLVRSPQSKFLPLHPLNNVPSFAPMDREAAAMVNPRKIIAQTPRAAAR